MGSENYFSCWLELIATQVFQANCNCYFLNPSTTHFSRIIRLASQQLLEMLHKEFVQSNSHSKISTIKASLQGFFTSSQNFNSINSNLTYLKLISDFIFLLPVVGGGLNL